MHETVSFRFNQTKIVIMQSQIYSHAYSCTVYFAIEVSPIKKHVMSIAIFFSIFYNFQECNLLRIYGQYK